MLVNKVLFRGHSQLANDMAVPLPCTLEVCTGSKLLVLFLVRSEVRNRARKLDTVEMLRYCLFRSFSRKSKEYISCFQHCHRKPNDVAVKPNSDAPNGSSSKPRLVYLFLAC